MRSQEDIECEQIGVEVQALVYRLLAQIGAEVLSLALKYPAHAMGISIQTWEEIRSEAVVMLTGLCAMSGKKVEDLHAHLEKKQV